MNIKLLSAIIVLTLLSACSSESSNTGASTGAGASIQSSSTVSPGSQADLVANVGDRVFFSFDSNELTNDSRAILDRQAQWLERYPQVTVLLAGNCDDRGTEEYNIGLGNRRSNVVRDYLVARGVTPSRVTTISYGKNRPSVIGDSEETRAQNRNAITSVR